MPTTRGAEDAGARHQQQPPRGQGALLGQAAADGQPEPTAADTQDDQPDHGGPDLAPGQPQGPSDDGRREGQR